jgi:hypothetical protein
MSLIFRWILPLGVAYIALFEGLFANIDFVFRRATVLWYIRVLAERWLGLHVPSWSIDLDQAPSGTEALVTLLIASIVIAALSAWWFGARAARPAAPRRLETWERLPAPSCATAPSDAQPGDRPS